MPRRPALKHPSDGEFHFIFNRPQFERVGWGRGRRKGFASCGVTPLYASHVAAPCEGSLEAPSGTQFRETPDPDGRGAAQQGGRKAET